MVSCGRCTGEPVRFRGLLFDSANELVDVVKANSPSVGLGEAQLFHARYVGGRLGRLVPFPAAVCDWESMSVLHDHPFVWNHDCCGIGRRKTN